MSKGGPRRPSGVGRQLVPAWQEEEVAMPAPAPYYAPRPPPAAGGIFKSAAVEVLRRTRRLMTTGEICRLALDWGLLTCSGKTPEATMASAMYGDIKRRDRDSLFIRPQEGMFGLREWVDGPYCPVWQTDHTSLMAAVSSVVSSNPVNKRPLCGRDAGAGGSGGGGNAARSKAAGQRKKARRAGSDKDEEDEWGGSDDGTSGDEDSESEAARAPGGEAADPPPRTYSLRKGEVGRLQDAAAAAAAPSPLRQASSQDPSALTGFRGSQRHTQSHHANFQQQQQQQSDAAPPLSGLDLPNLRPVSAQASGPNGAGSQIGGGSSAAANSGAGLLSPPLFNLLQSPHIAWPPSSAATASTGGAGGGLFSPVSLLDIRSPTLAPHLLPSPFAGCTPAGIPNLLSPFEPLAGPGQRPGSSGRQRRLATALKSAAAAAAAGDTAGAAAAPSAPGTAVSTMVPICTAAGGEGVQLAPLPLLPLFLGQYGRLPAAGQTPVGESAGQLCSGAEGLDLQAAAGAALNVAAGIGAGSIAGIHYNIAGAGQLAPHGRGSSQGGKGQQAVSIMVGAGCWLPPPGVADGIHADPGALAQQGLKPIPAAVPAPAPTPPTDHAGSAEAAAAAAQPEQAIARSAADGDHSAATGATAAAAASSSSGSAAIAAKVREVEGKVRQIEEKWGPMSLKTGKAYFLLHHACRHPQAAPLFAREAEAALQRAHDIMRHNSQLGLPGGDAADEYQQLLQGIRSAAATAAATGGGGGREGAS